MTEPWKWQCWLCKKSGWTTTDPFFEHERSWRHRIVAFFHRPLYRYRK